MRKQTSFKNEIIEIPPVKRTTFELAADEEDEDEGAIEDYTDDEDSAGGRVADSAIDDDLDDDDDDEWEDEGDGEVESDDSPKQLTFPRVDSRPDLVSRRSAIWDQLHGSEALQRSMSTAQLRRSRTSPPHGPSMAASSENDLPPELRDPQNRPGPPVTLAHPAGPPISPSQTRKKMITEELGVSLRKHMLNERQQRYYFGSNPPAGANNGLPRRAHTSVDMRRLASEAAAISPQASGAAAAAVAPRRPRPGLVDPPTIGVGAPGVPWSDSYQGDLIDDYHQAGW